MLIGLFLGWLFFDNQQPDLPDTQKVHEHEGDMQAETQVWTCAMHPQIRQNEPGQCPICGMDLIPVSEMGDDELTLAMSEEAVKLANIQTAKVVYSKPEKNVLLQGKVEVNEQNVSVITSRFPGRIEKLYVDFTGMQVYKGQQLASVYSPQLITAQKELFEAIKYKESNPVLYNAARSKLKLWNITEEQIDAIEQSGEPKVHIDVLSPLSGVVLKRNVATGDYVKEGTALFEIANLYNVWVVFEAYEPDIPWLKTGDKVTFTVNALPGEVLTGRISFIDPVVDPLKRTVSVRLNMANPKGKLKPEMFVKGEVKASLPFDQPQLIVPKSAVLWTGKRSVVYVSVPQTDRLSFQYREVVLGQELGTHFIVEEGLSEGEEIVIHGTFKVDAAAQLAGKTSMMNRPETAAQFTVSENFRQQLTLFVNSYIELKNALVASDEDQAKILATALAKQLTQTDMKLLEGEAHEVWMKANKQMKQSIDEIKATTDMEKQRAAFKPLSEALSDVVEAFGVHGITLYEDYCPMAVGDQGAIWLSEIKEIQNPYFGEKMLKCGEVKKTFGKKTPAKSKQPPTGHQH